MKTMISRLNEWDEMIFRLFNQHFYRRSLYVLLTKITHLGGARITIFTLLLLLVFGKDPYQTLAKAAAFSLFISHIPVQIGKHLFRRDRPYLTLSNTFVVKNPLKDHSFPSGHSTAIFAATTPFMVGIPILTYILLPLSLLVASSRIFLGLHYPSDVIVGILLGFITGIICFSLFPL
ncbi:MAG TPA: phosphatase PAP2 family protein [Massilibacterium sp.]|nr:phosphatase PAP2 family protein [Massilibacterium sp.]